MGVIDDLRGQVPVGFVVLKDFSERDPQNSVPSSSILSAQASGLVASVKRVIVVQRLPKTRSGKILRSTMRSMIDGRDYEVPSTIEDAWVLPELAGGINWPFHAT